jgi:hypothetical protein
MKLFFFMMVVLLGSSSFAQEASQEFKLKIVNGTNGQTALSLGSFKGTSVPSLCDGPSLFCFEEINVKFRPLSEELQGVTAEVDISLVFSYSTGFWNGMDRDLWVLIEDLNGNSVGQLSFVPCEDIDQSTEVSDIVKYKIQRLGSEDTIHVGEINEFGYCLEKKDTQLLFLL